MELPSDEVTLQQTVLKMSPEKERSFELYTKEIVRHRGGSWVRNTEPLPEGWILINHHAGFPLYFHRETRVVTWSRTGFQFIFDKFQFSKTETRPGPIVLAVLQ